MDVPSVPLISSSDSFSPSVFMSVDTQVGLSTFGGVSQPGVTQDRSSSLRSRSVIKIPSRYLHPVTPAKSKRMSKRVADVLVRLVISNPYVIHCGGKVGRGVNSSLALLPLLLASLALPLLKLRLSRIIGFLS